MSEIVEVFFPIVFIIYGIIGIIYGLRMDSKTTGKVIKYERKYRRHGNTTRRIYVDYSINNARKQRWFRVWFYKSEASIVDIYYIKNNPDIASINKPFNQILFSFILVVIGIFTIINLIVKIYI